MLDGIRGFIETQRQVSEQIYKSVEPVLTMLEERFVQVYLKEAATEEDGTIAIWFTTRRDPDGIFSAYNLSVPSQAIDNRDLDQIRAHVEKFYDKMFGF